MRNWLHPLVELDSALPICWVEPSPSKVGDLSVDNILIKKDDLAIVVGLYNMQNRLEYAVDRSTTDRLDFICKHEECPFMLCSR